MMHRFKWLRRRSSACPLAWPADLEKHIKEICETRVRYGYRHPCGAAARGLDDQHQANSKALCRLGLQLRVKTPKRRVRAKLREDRRPPGAPNEVWAMDLLSDQLFDGRKIRVLTIVDGYSKISPAIDVRARYTGADVVATFERVCAQHGVSRTIRIDNGSEFISRDLDLWPATVDGMVSLIAAKMGYLLEGDTLAQPPT
jgi:putative transposase